jgi:hypothetical protein
MLPSLPLGACLAALQLLSQAAAPTVGDTVWVSRSLKAPAGSVVRAAPWPDDPSADLQPLGPAIVSRLGDSVEIRYPLVGWTPGAHEVDIPGPTILGPGARVDSLPSRPATVYIGSVLPDTVPVDSLAPQPPDEAVGGAETSWLPVIQFSLLGLAVAAGLLVFRRRRRGEGSVPVSKPPAAPDVMRWAGSGELRAAQGAALARIRAIIAAAVPAAHPGLAIDDCIAILRGAKRDWPLLELEGLLLALESERFAPTAGDPDLVERADALGARLERAG